MDIMKRDTVKTWLWVIGLPTAIFGGWYAGYWIAMWYLARQIVQ